MMNMFSPPRREKARGDDSHLPKGDCRYILLHPEVKGLRCACVGFALNQTIPGSTCDCGHQACYHEPDREGGSVERQELEALKQKISQLEEKLDQERYGRRSELVERLGRMEETFDRAKAENDNEIKNVHRAMSGMWHHVGHLEKRTPQYEDRMEGLLDDVEKIRHQLMEVDDASMKLEDRVEMLEKENISKPSELTGSRRRKASTPPSLAPEDADDHTIKSEVTTRASSQIPLHILTSDEPLRIQSFRERVASVGSGSQAWTVHISLLPILSQPFPFEKDTAAYKRCLSRGLHRVVAVPDVDSNAFKTAVSEAFSEVLRGRIWQPLVARLCDAKNLFGLPMLRQLPDHLVTGNYDKAFLQMNCAVTDEGGKILDLYLAMSNDTISWDELKEVTPYLDGLEASWIYDPFLDGHFLSDEDYDGPDQDIGILGKRPAAGDILTTWSPSTTRVKRKESEISRTPSFGSSTDSESSRKLRRQYSGTTIEVVGGSGFLRNVY